MQRTLSPLQSSPLQDAHRFLTAIRHWTMRDCRWMQRDAILRL
jgi:hypothetical protein